MMTYDEAKVEVLTSVVLPVMDKDYWLQGDTWGSIWRLKRIDRFSHIELPEIHRYTFYRMNKRTRRSLRSDWTQIQCVETGEPCAIAFTSWQRRVARGEIKTA
jgi:hypothetical protein